MQEIKVYKGHVQLLETVGEVSTWLKGCEDNSIVTFDWETTGLDYNAIPLGLSLHQRGVSPCFIPVDYFFDKGIPMEALADICNREFRRLRLIAHNAKYDSMINVMNGIKDENCNIIADTLIMIHLYDPALEKQLEKRVRADFGYEKPTFEKISGKKWGNINWAKDGNELLPLLAGYAGEDTYWETQLYYKYKPLLDEDAWRILHKIELPLIKILRDAKIRGVKIDVALLKDMRERAAQKLIEAKESIYEAAGCVFNLNSNPQKQKVFFEKLKLPVISKTKSGAPSTDAKSAEEWAEMGYPIGEALVAYSELQKLLSGYLIPIPELLDEENVLRGDLNSCGTKTGRCCIEQHQRVMTVGGWKMIKDICVGDLVYCYDDNGNLQVRKVLNKWNKGTLPLVEVRYQSSGDMHIGSLLCTPDHSLKTKHRGWVMAKDLMREKVFHLRRSDNHTERGYIRPRLYGSNSFMEDEQQTIKRLVFGASSEMHIHHKDGDTTNNSISNLEILTHEEHARLHLTERMADGSFVRYDPTGTHREVPCGEDSPHFIHKTKWSLLRMLMEAGGCPTKVPMDFQTFKDKCKFCGINLAGVIKRFNNKGEYLSKKRVQEVSDLTIREQQKLLGVGYYHVNGLMEYYGVTNHLILSVKRTRSGVCYDIEVEDFNNFICEELCVHNSSSNPNLQNQPNNHDFPIRCAFVPREGYVFVNYDYSQLELRVMAHMSKDKKFIDIFMNGRDPHGEVARSVGITRKQAKCVNPNTLIQTDLGVIRIGELSDVRQEDTFDASIAGSVWNGKSFIGINSFYSNGADDTLLIVSHRGAIRCSRRHKLLLADGSLKAAEDILKGDILAEPSVVTFIPQEPIIEYNPFFESGAPFKITMDGTWAYIAGVLVGGGCFSKEHIGVAVGNGHKSWRRILKDIFASKGLPLVERVNKNYLYLGSSRFVKFMLPLGLSDIRGKKNFKIPLWVLNGSLEIRKSFLCGLIDTDGTVDESGTTSICTKSVQLVEDLCFLLNSIEYSYGVEPSYNKTYGRMYYRVHIYSTSLKGLFDSGYMRCPHKLESLKVRVSKIAKCPHRKENTVVHIENVGKDYLCDINVEDSSHLYMAGTMLTHNTLNFGVLYGMGPDKYMHTFGVSKERALEMIDGYHSTYEGFARWKMATENYAKKHGYVKNLFGRVRRFTETTKNPFEGIDKRKYFGELRQAVNSIIQGTGADIVKLATVAMCKKFEELNLDAHFLLQVHDEVLIEARIDQMREIERVVIDCMENTVKLCIPLEADGKILANWGEMKDDTVVSLPDRFDYSLYSLLCK